MAKGKSKNKKVKGGTGRKRGRPQKTKVEMSTKKVHKPYQKRKTAEDIEFESKELVKNQKTGKHMGFCPDCESVVADFDINNGRFICISCQREGSIKKLKIERVHKQVWGSKREYLSQTVFSGSGLFGGFHSGHNAEVEKPEESGESDI